MTDIVERLRADANHHKQVAGDCERKAERKNDSASEAGPDCDIFASDPVPDSNSRAQNERPDNREPSDRKVEHSVPFHDAITLAFSGVLVGLAFGLMLGLFLATMAGTLAAT